MMCLKKLSENAASVYDGYKKQNPLMMRKKMSVKDVVYRKDEPDTELFRFEAAWDTELYALLAVLLCLVILGTYKLCRLFHH